MYKDWRVVNSRTIGKFLYRIHKAHLIILDNFSSDILENKSAISSSDLGSISPSYPKLWTQILKSQEIQITTGIYDMHIFYDTLWFQELLRGPS